MGSRPQRMAENEVVFRDANERLMQVSVELRIPDPTPFICECDDATCTHVLTLSLDEYRAVRSHPQRFLILDGHEREHEPVVERKPTFVVVEKAKT